MRELRIEQQSDFIERIITINRVTKVTKGGRKIHFTALVVIGDTKGRVGFALGKANEVAEAIRKGLACAKKELVSITREGSTIAHEIIGKYGAAKVLLMPASEGTGVIACGPVRAICEAAGIRDILTKSLNSNNPVNVIKATMQGLTNLKTKQNEEKDNSAQESAKQPV